MCRVFLEVPKNQFKRFTLDTTPPAYVNGKARLPRRLAGGKHLVLASSLLFRLVLTTGFQISHCPGGERKGLSEGKRPARS